MKTLMFLTLALSSFLSFAKTDPIQWNVPDWSREAELPASGERANIYQFAEDVLPAVTHQGKIHALHYPVSITELLVPYEPLKKFLNLDSAHPFRAYVQSMVRARTGWNSLNEMFHWLGLTDYPEQEQRGQYAIPYPQGKKPEHPMGVTVIQTKNGKGFTFSCATCHSGELFGTKVLGMSQRFPRANEFFVMAKEVLPFVDPSMFMVQTGASLKETKMYEHTRRQLLWVDAVRPVQVGVDTSLAQVALALAHRGEDEYAEKNWDTALMPRYNALKERPADSKPAVWWNLKYKTRWLSDGSIVSGNPIFTNYLWNEIGRSADLHKLEKWLEENKQITMELTAMAFATEAPRYLDFFPETSLDLNRAKEGQKLFNQNCLQCHGSYEKGWEQKKAQTFAELVKTTRVHYHKKTPVIDVGTDPLRYEGMKEFASSLNNLTISKKMNTVVEPQKGYVPPPLVGIWARWPYFHNNSAPHLCAVLTRASERPREYWAHAAQDPKRDFDQECNGYFSGDKVPASWKEDPQMHYDVTKPGLSNQGHEKMLLNPDGTEKFSVPQKLAIIEFLKTL